ncbi:MULTISPECIES: DUF1822 family protein [unclassified Tolypothrix]|uniref:DUF1822 family protein n=2 Tax=Tolypothrix TaxID=111782 RepID=UPI0005EABE77|nr:MULTISPECIES: DUF1822 family protein [unclassified Tolypothrix]EKE98272.1 hypothetical protein FDUTEX481_04427 [Tolypothrix sp. PCC 7601]MBE9084007.1 DUF1822 family protein [Tolypothrix sp. LEGE 11397]UYD30511.1 DUF1822 family protein [Tolypothrix sp. PCC 7712]BAY95288.1 hypothetical protein NIES3275_73450 [Microchaete diplosiphon NIES-3275]
MNTLPMSFEFERLPTEAISLDAEEMHQAIEFSRPIPDDGRQWQTYLNALALFVFKKWLQERDDNLIVNWQDCTITKPALANVIPTVANLQVGNFKVCLITIGNSWDEQIPLSRLVVDIPEFVPHFYVFVEVLESQEFGVVRGFISYPQLIENINNVQTVSPQADWNYEIPLTWFDNDPNRLLLYLRTLQPEAISLPAIPNNRQQTLAAQESELSTLLWQLQDPEIELWEILNWQQGCVVLTSPELLDWIYQLQTSSLNIEEYQTQTTTAHTTLLQASTRDLIKLITQPAINVGRWLWDELDEIGESLAWTLLPRFSPLREIRSPAEELEAITSQLQTQGLEIPLAARSGYQSFLLAGIPLRLYAIGWNSSTLTEPNSWNLLLILGAPSPNTLPENFKFRVSDKTGVLLEQSVNPQQRNWYLYTCLVGNWDEKFIVTTSLGDDVEVTLPPFGFDITR